MIESEIETKMRKMIQDSGGEFIKFVSPSTKGVPDRIAILPGGRVIFVELKKDGGRATPIQKRMHKKLRRLGADVRLVVGMAQAIDFVREVCADV